MSALAFNHSPTSVRTQLGVISAFQRDSNHPGNQILNQFPLFREFPKSEEKSILGSERVVSVEMPTSYSEETASKMKNLILQFLKTKGEGAPGCQFTCKQQLPSQNPDWVQNIQKEAEAFCLMELGMKNIPLGDFSDRDLEVLDFSREEIGRMNALCKKRWNTEFSLKTISCFDYALLKAKEPGAREQIFCKAKSTTEEFERLIRWGYDVVDSPKLGDLVLYIDNGDITHMGYYMGNGKVLSKFGNENPNASLHPLDMVYDQYGSQIAFYRKNPAKNGVYFDGPAVKLKSDIKQ